MCKCSKGFENGLTASVDHYEKLTFSKTTSYIVNPPSTCTYGWNIMMLMINNVIRDNMCLELIQK